MAVFLFFALAALGLRLAFTPAAFYIFNSALFNQLALPAMLVQAREFAWGLLLSALLPSVLIAAGIFFYRGGALPSRRAIGWLTALILAGLVLVKFGFYPGFYLSSDEYAYNFQAQLIAMGKLQIAAPADPQAFTSAAIYCDKFWTSSYQPGWPAALALGLLLHLQPLVGCLLWLAVCPLIYGLGCRLWGEEEGRGAVLCYVLSSNFWLLAWSEFPHLFTAWLTLLSWYCFLRGGRWGAGAVLAWAFILCTRLQDIPVALTPCCYWLLVERGFLKGRDPLRGGGLKTMVLMVAGGVVAGVALCALLNQAQTGDFKVLPYALYHGSEYGLRSWHGLAVGLYDLLFYLARVAWWSPPLLLPLCCRAKNGPATRALLATIFVQILFYIGHPSNAMVEWGARFYAISLLCLCLLGGLGLKRVKVPSLAWLLCLLTALHTVWLCHGDWGKGNDLGSALEHRLAAGPPCLLFVRQLPQGWGTETLLHNHADLRSPVMVLWLDEESNEKLRKSLPQLQPLILDMANPADLQIRPYAEVKELPEGKQFFLAGVNYLLAVRDQTKALECFKAALAVHETARTRALVGQLQADIMQPQEAALNLERALELDPGLVDVRLRYIELLCQLGKGSEARQQLTLLDPVRLSPEARLQRQALVQRASALGDAQK